MATQLRNGEIYSLGVTILIMNKLLASRVHKIDNLPQKILTQRQFGT
jgi:hypothetical protein